MNISMAVFLRSDIYYKVKEVAREPDKIQNSRIQWDDPDLLVRVIEERFTALHAGSIEPKEMWDRYFSRTVVGIPAKDYILSRILPRPRDLVFFVKSAIAAAVNHQHAVIEEKDILSAERQYSQFAYDSILVENGIPDSSLEQVVLEFLGCRSELTYDEVKKNLLTAGVTALSVDSVIDYLMSLTFLGIEVEEGRFRFAEDPQNTKKNQILARKLSERSPGPKRYKVHPAFSNFLEVTSA